jgi:hypothetical protein
MTEEERLSKSREIEFLLDVMEYLGYSRGMLSRSSDEDEMGALLAEEGSEIRLEVRFRLMNELGCLSKKEKELWDEKTNIDR